MMEFPYGMWDIPEKCFLDKRVYKRLFYENTDFTVTDKKWFTKDIDGISWLYTLKPELTMMHAFEEEHYEYDEIVIMEVEVTGFDHVERLADIMHRSIPYPLLIVFRRGEKVCLSVADKRYSLTDEQAATVSKLWVTDMLVRDGLSITEEQFIEQLAFDRQPQLHLKAFYHGWLDAFYAYDISKVTGEFAMETEQDKKERRRSALNEYRTLEDEIAELKKKLKKESAFSRKMELNVEIKELQDQLNKVAEQL